jgi:hypothetical protein
MARSAMEEEEMNGPTIDYTIRNSIYRGVVAND